MKNMGGSTRVAFLVVLWLAGAAQASQVEVAQTCLSITDSAHCERNAISVLGDADANATAISVTGNASATCFDGPSNGENCAAASQLYQVYPVGRMSTAASVAGESRATCISGCWLTVAGSAFGDATAQCDTTYCDSYAASVLGQAEGDNYLSVCNLLEVACV